MNMIGHHNIFFNLYGGIHLWYFLYQRIYDGSYFCQLYHRTG